MKFDDVFAYLVEMNQRTHLTRDQVEKIYIEVAQSVGVGPFITKDDESTTLKSKDKINALSDQTKYDQLEDQLVTTFSRYGGVNKVFRTGLIADDFDILVRVLDKNKLWREYPAAS